VNTLFRSPLRFGVSGSRLPSLHSAASVCDDDMSAYCMCVYARVCQCVCQCVCMRAQMCNLLSLDKNIYLPPISLRSSPLAGQEGEEGKEEQEGA